MWLCDTSNVSAEPASGRYLLYLIIVKDREDIRTWKQSGLHQIQQTEINRSFFFYVTYGRLQKSNIFQVILGQLVHLWDLVVAEAWNNYSYIPTFNYAHMMAA